MIRNQIVCADALTYLKTLPDESINMCVTSPPYWQQRDYGTAGQIGMEESLGEYLKRLVGVFREVRRVLRSDGTCWINMGDKYAGSGMSGGGKNTIAGGSNLLESNYASLGLADKQLIGLPWRLAFALQADGWWLRSDVIWHKPSVMPESVRDRPTRDHEYVFLTTKAARYWYDTVAIREPIAAETIARERRGRGSDHKNTRGAPGQAAHTMQGARRVDPHRTVSNYRNKRTVWSVAATGTKQAHFATYPPTLIEPMILAGCPEAVCVTCGSPHVRITERHFHPPINASAERNVRGTDGQKRQAGGWNDTPRGRVDAETVGWKAGCECNAGTARGIVLDPFMGSGTTALVAFSLHRDYVGAEINENFAAMAVRRLEYGFSSDDVERIARGRTTPMFSGVI